MTSLCQSRAAFKNAPSGAPSLTMRSAKCPLKWLSTCGCANGAVRIFGLATGERERKESWLNS